MHLDVGRNQKLIGDYLADVNKVSIISTFIILFLYFKTIKKYKNNYFVNYLNKTVIFSFLGFLWFLLSFYESTGDTIQATYFIHAFHMMILIAAIYLQNIKDTNQTLYKLILIILGGIFIFNFQSYLSHFPVSFIEDIDCHTLFQENKN